jgi:hypothetical protein
MHLVIRIHHMAHNYNWVVQMFSNLPLVAKIETSLQSMYVYFSDFPKMHMELAKLAKKIGDKRLEDHL